MPMPVIWGVALFLGVIALIFFAFLYPLVQATYVLERKLRQGD